MAAGALAWLACAGATAEAQARVPSGDSCGPTSGVPVAGALVSTDDGRVTAETGADGWFQIELAMGPRTLSITRQGYADLTRPIDVGAEPLELELRAHRPRPFQRGCDRFGGPGSGRGADFKARHPQSGDRGAQLRPGDAVPAAAGPVGHPVLGFGRAGRLLVHLPARHPADADERHDRRHADQRAGGLGVLLLELRRLRQRRGQHPGTARRRHLLGRRRVVRRLDQLRERRVHRRARRDGSNGSGQLRRPAPERLAELAGTSAVASRSMARRPCRNPTDSATTPA